MPTPAYLSRDGFREGLGSHRFATCRYLTALKVLELKVAEADQNAREIISIEKDIEYMKKSLERIEALVASQ